MFRHSQCDLTDNAYIVEDSLGLDGSADMSGVCL